MKKELRVDKSFVISEKALKNDLNTGTEYIEITGYASKMYDSNGNFVIDADQENINSFGIDLSRLQKGILPVLFAHDQKKVVGKVKSATYEKDGLKVVADIIKLPNDNLTNYVFEGVKAGIINAFSVGVLIKELDVVEQDDTQYLQLIQSEIIELSVLAVPSNPEATFEVRNIGTKSITTISRKDIKAENPNICEDMEACGFIQKGLTLEDTLNESWMQSRQFALMLSALGETIEDNWYANKWDELTAEEAKNNIVDAFASFITSKVQFKEEVKKEDIMPEQVGQVATKGVEEVTPEVGTEVINEDTPAGTVDTSNDVPSENPSDELEGTKPEVAPTEVVPKPEEVAQPEEVPETPKEATMSDALKLLSEIDLDTLDESQIEELYNIVGPLSEGIEGLVFAAVAEELKVQLNQN